MSVAMVVAFDPGVLLPWRIETTSGKLEIEFAAADADSEAHERLHVADFRTQTFEKTKAYVTDQERSRFCRFEKAWCWKGVCENEAPRKFNSCGFAWSVDFVDLPYAISTGLAEVWNYYIALARRAREACEAATRSLADAEQRCRQL